MSTPLDEVLSGAKSEPQPSAAQQSQSEPVTTADNGATGEPAQQPAAPAANPDPGATGGEAGGATPAPQDDGTKLVPVAALEAERKGRQDWKEKAIRAEAALEELRKQQSQPSSTTQQDQPTQWTPEVALLNERMNMSEIMVRQQHQDVDEMVEVFKKAAEQNPALGTQLAQQRHPWQWMYDQAKRMKAMEEIGADPAAYKQRLRDELLAELKNEQASATPAAAAAPVAVSAPAPVIPKTLATARSSAPRSAPAWTGPTPLNDILNIKR